MANELLPEAAEKVARMRRDREKVAALAEKIAAAIAGENVSVDMAEHALRRAEAIVRARTIVTLTCP